MELPRYLRAVQRPGRAGRPRSRSWPRELGFDRLARRQRHDVHRARSRASWPRRCRARRGAPLGVEANTEAEVARLAAAPALRAADAVVAVGGGKTIDVAKSACALAELPLIVVPTQLTADGIASPVSVIRDADGRLRSGPGRLPIAVAVDLEVVAAAPPARTRAGPRRPARQPLRAARLAARGRGRAARRSTTSPRCCRRARSTWSTHAAAGPGRRPARRRSSCTACCAGWC